MIFLNRRRRLFHPFQKTFYSPSTCRKKKTPITNFAFRQQKLSLLTHIPQVQANKRTYQSSRPKTKRGARDSSSRIKQFQAPRHGYAIREIKRKPISFMDRRCTSSPRRSFAKRAYKSLSRTITRIACDARHVHIVSPRPPHNGRLL